MNDWSGISHFKREEWGPEPEKVCFDLVRAMDRVREEAGRKIFVLESFALTGHAPRSLHKTGRAVDFRFEAGLGTVAEFLLLSSHRFGGIGFYPNSGRPFWHADLRTGPRLIWTRVQGRYEYGFKPLARELLAASAPGQAIDNTQTKKERKMNPISAILRPIMSEVVSLIMTRDNFAVWGDKFFDLIEEMVENSKTPIDDMIVLPMVRAARQALSIPDLPDRG